MSSALPVLGGILGGAANLADSVIRGFQQKRTWEREDTAVQRRAKDMEAAGLSKTLAAGSAAQTSAPIDIGVGEIASGAMSGAEKGMAIMRQKADVSKTAAEVGLLELQKDKVKAETESVKLANQLATGTNPYKTESMRVEAELAAQMAPGKLRKQQMENEQLGLKNQTELIDQQLKKAGIRLEAVKLIREQLAARADDIGLVKGAELDLMAKQIAYDIQSYNFDYYREKGVPSNIGWDALTRLGGYGAGMLEELLNKLRPPVKKGGGGRFRGGKGASGEW